MKDKLVKRKEWFFDSWLKDPDAIQSKLIRFVDLNKWKQNNAECDKLYGERGYKFMDLNNVFNYVCNILDVNLTS